MPDINIAEFQDSEKPLVPFGTRVIGTENPTNLTLAEFNQSKDLLWHGSDAPFEFNPKFDYSDPSSLASKDGSLTLGLGFYTTPDRDEAVDYSTVRQNASKDKTPHVQALIPYKAVMLDLRDGDRLERNTPVPKDLFERWREEIVRWYKDQDKSQLPWYEIDFYDNYLQHLDKLAQFPDIDLRSMLWTGVDKRVPDGSYPSPSWMELFAKFMIKEEYDGVIYIEGGESENSKDSPSFCFYNTEVLDTYEGWQKRKNEVAIPA